MYESEANIDKMRVALYQLSQGTSKVSPKDPIFKIVESLGLLYLSYADDLISELLKLKKQRNYGRRKKRATKRRIQPKKHKLASKDTRRRSKKTKRVSARS